MNRIRVALQVVKTGVLAMVALHALVLVMLALRDRDPSWLNLTTVLELHQLWPSLGDWKPGLLVSWLAFFALLGMIWWRLARRLS